MALINAWPCALHPASGAYIKGRLGGVARCKECTKIYRRQHDKTYGQLLHRRFSQARRQAAIRGLDWLLSEYEWSEIVARPCIYRLDGVEHPPGIRSGVDRVDSSIGYTFQNSQPCCYRHNMCKGDWLTHAQMLETVVRYRIPCGNKPSTRKR